MATCSPYSKEKANHIRLCNLLVDIGRQVFQDVFDQICPPSSLNAFLSSNRWILNNLRTSRILYVTQWDTLFPPLGAVTCTSADFDITLLFLLLRNICNLRAPGTGWDRPPLVSDLSMEADLVRIKRSRNELYAHSTNTAIPDNQFQILWGDIEAALLRLGGSKYQVQIQNFKDDTIDPASENRFKVLWKSWEEGEEMTLNAVREGSAQTLDAIGELHKNVDKGSAQTVDAIGELHKNVDKGSAQTVVAIGELHKNVDKGSAQTLDAIGELQENVDKGLKKIDELQKKVDNLELGTTAKTMDAKGELQENVDRGATISINGTVKVLIAGGLVVTWAAGSAYIIHRYIDDPQTLKELVNQAIIPSLFATVASVCEILTGSFKILVEIRSLVALDEIWKSYIEGDMKKKLEKVLITDDMRNLAPDDAENVDISLMISEDEYKKARDYLLESVEGSKKTTAEMNKLKVEVDKGSAKTLDAIVELQENVDIVTDSSQHESFSFAEGDEKNPENIIKNISNILNDQESLLLKLYPPRKTARNSASKIEGLIKESVKSPCKKLKDAKHIKISVAAFGKLGKGKSYVLNDILRHGLDDKELVLLPSGTGDSKTPVPIRIKYGKEVNVIAKRKEKSETLFSNVGPATLPEAANSIKKLFESQNFNDLSCIDVSAPLPVFKYLQDNLKSKCVYQDVEVEVEFVDLPGEGDNHGNALIGKQLDVADVILLFKEGDSGRQVTTYDLENVFRRRKLFEYTNRPKFVVIENDRFDQVPDDQSAHRREVDHLKEAWDNLLNMEEDSNGGAGYQLVYERLPLTTTKEFLEKFQEESRAIIFGNNHKNFHQNLIEALSHHVNGVILKKNVHPVLLEINKNASTMGMRISSLMSKKKKEVKKHAPVRGFHYIQNNPLASAFQLKLDDHEDDDFFYNLERDCIDLNVEEIPTMVKAHEDLMDLFHQETTVQYLTSKLRTALIEHYKTLLELSDFENGLLISDQSFVRLAEMSCETLVNPFIEEEGRDFVDTSLKKLDKKRPNKKMQKKWVNEEEDKATLLKEHCDGLLQHLTRDLSKGTRKQGLVTLLEKLSKAIDDRMLWGVDIDDNPNIAHKKLELIKNKNTYHKKVSTKIIREVNPHPDTKKEVLNSKEVFPDPPKMLDEHTLPPSNHNLDKVFQLLKNKKQGALDELRRKLKLAIGSLPVPKGKDDSEWVKILLNVLFEPRFHHSNFGEHVIPDDLKVNLDSISQHYIHTAKQQLFAFQKSTASCSITKDESAVYNDTITITFNEAKDGLIASMNSVLNNELEKLSSLDDPKMQLAPIFIPSIHYGPSRDKLGNLYLEDDPWKVKDDNDEDDETVEGQITEQASGLEDLKATIFCVVEPGHFEKFRETLQTKTKPPNSNITFRYVVLPQNGRGIGVSRSVIKVLAECLKLPSYWTIDDDLKSLKEFNKNAQRWISCTIGRALLYGQCVLQDCTNKAVNHLKPFEKVRYVVELMGLFPEWAEIARAKANELLFDGTTHKRIMLNISCLSGEFSEEMRHGDCNGDPFKEQLWLEAKEKWITRFREIMLKDSFKRIGRVSIGHESGRRSGYHVKCHMHYRKSAQNDQLVLHNTAAQKGFNFVTDEVLLKEEEGTVHQTKLRDVGYMGHKWEDKSFCKALEVFGIVGFQVITVVQKNEKLRNAFGRTGNSYAPEELGNESDASDEDMED